MNKLQYSLTAKISAFFLLYLSGYMMLSSAYILLVGARIEELVVRSIWPFSWLLTKAATALPLSILLNVILFNIFCQQQENNKTARKLFSMAGTASYRVVHRLCSYVLLGSVTPVTLGS